MILDSLNIKRNTYGPNEGKYTGEVSFKGKEGAVSIIMSPEVTESFLALAGDLIIAHVEVAGRELQKSIDHVVGKAIESNKPPKEIAEQFTADFELLKHNKNAGDEIASLRDNDE